ncbi:MAG: ABC transporter permease [Christensenellales bacterium]
MGSAWVGFEHFEYLFSLPGFWKVFRNSIFINFYQLLFGFPAPILFAIMLNEIVHLRFKKIVQTISYLPHFLSWVILAGMFTQLLSPSTGAVNLLLKALKIEPIYFLASPKWFRSILVATNIWKSVGWSSIVYLAALSNVDVEMYEAARIDGATKLQEIWYITLPSISGVITIMLIFRAGSLISDNFDQVFNLYNPAVYEVGDVLGTYTYRLGLRDMQYSLSTAVGLFTNVISFTLVILTNAIAKRINDYGIW